MAKIENAKSIIDTVKEQLENSKEYDMDKLNEDRKAALIEKEAYAGDIKDADTRININSEALGLIKNKYSKLKELGDKLSTVGALSNTANGKLAGKDKIQLETLCRCIILTGSLIGQISVLWLCRRDNMS
ncbi:MAG: hypothetical protein ACLT2Z_01730 [Eubacterium sp.]